MIPIDTFPFILMLTGSIITLAVMASGFQLHLNVQKEKKQKTGLEQLKILKEILLNLQKHRGISYRILWGERNLESTLIHIQQTNAQLVHSLNSLKSNPHLADRWLAFEDHWQRLSRQCLKLEAENNLEQHNKIITTFIYLMEDVSEHFCLSETQLGLDTALNVNQNWKEVLTTAEWVGQARALGSGMLTSGHCGSVERIRMSFIRSKLEKYTTQSHSHSSASLQLSHFVKMIDQELLKKTKPDITAKEYFDQASLTIEQYMRQFDTEIHNMRSVIL